MVANPVVVVISEDGKVAIPKELQGDPRFQTGAKLQLVPIEQNNSSDKGDWHRLRGALSHLDVNLNALLEQERLLENEQETSLVRETRG